MGMREALRLSPFEALVYHPRLRPDLADLLAPPYDVIDFDRLPLLQSRPYNVVHLIRPAGTDEEAAHASAAQTLARWQRDGVLVHRAPALYVYEHQSGDTVLRGVIGTVPVGPLAAEAVLPHEDVMPEPVLDRAALMALAEAQLEPILLTVADVPELERVITATTTAEPLLEAVVDDVRHRLWPVPDSAEPQRLQASLADHSAVIADGHHRFAAYARLRETLGSDWASGLALVVDTTRYSFAVGAIARTIAGLSWEAAVDAVRPVARVAPLPADLAAAEASLRAAAERGPALVVMDAHQAALLTHFTDATDGSLVAKHSQLWRDLPTALLHEWLLPEIWRDEDRGDGRVTYHHDPREALAAAARTSGVAVLTPPVPVATVRALAADGELLPRKSTSFEPKPPAGLLIRPMTPSSSASTS